MNMNIAYACNDGYIMQTGISLISLFENNRHFEKITLYLISCGISDENIDVIRDICQRYGRDMEVVNMNTIAPDLNISAIGRHIETIYAKIFFSRIEGVEKMLYIDSDTIIAGDLSGLWIADMTGCYMGMVQTYTGVEAKKLLGIPAGVPFYNDGIALVNVKYCKENDLIEKCKAVIEEFNGNPPVLSEGTLNKVCQGRILQISPRYNMMAGLYQRIKMNLNYVTECIDYSKEDLRDSYEHPVIIHFLSGFYNRPWSMYCTHPLRGEFLHYKEMSPWKNLPLTRGKLPLRLRILASIFNLLGPRQMDKLRTSVR
jgi:lipopolysaccharide biosynthesis glycosyltransferase